jgi:hypothetical protein
MVVAARPLDPPAAPAGELTFACAACGGVARPAVHAVRAGGLELSCRRCGATVAVPIALEQRPLPVPGGCPKCGAPRAADACPRCGLIYRRWTGRREPRSDQLETERAWREVQASFFDPSRHALFIAHCLHAGELAYAAGRYAEEERGRDAERARIAWARRRQVRVIADAMIDRRGPPPAHPGGAARRLLALTASVIVVLLVLWMGAVVIRPGVHRRCDAAGLPSMEAALSSPSRPAWVTPAGRFRAAPSDLESGLTRDRPPLPPRPQPGPGSLSVRNASLQTPRQCPYNSTHEGS